MPRLLPPPGSASPLYNGCRVDPENGVDVLPRDVDALKGVGWSEVPDPDPEPATEIEPLLSEPVVTDPAIGEGDTE